MVRATQRWSIREREPIGVRVGVHSGAFFFDGRWISMVFCMILLTLVWEDTPKLPQNPLNSKEIPKQKPLVKGPVGIFQVCEISLLELEAIL